MLVTILIIFYICHIDEVSTHLALKHILAGVFTLNPEALNHLWDEKEPESSGVKIFRLSCFLYSWYRTMFVLIV